MFQYLKENFQKYINIILQLNDTPESIARGVSIGMFVAMTPTIGLQMLIVIFISFFIRLNRVAGCIMVYISNPITLVPVYWFDYWAGANLMGYEMIGYENFKLLFIFKTHTFYDQFIEFCNNCLSLGLDVIVPMFVGGMFWGVLFGVPLYPITLKAVRRRRESAKKEGEQA